MSRVLHKLFMYLNGRGWTFPVIFALNLNKALLTGRSAMMPASVKAGSCL